MSDETWRALDPARRRAGLTVRDLHLRCIALGGTATLQELSTYLTAGTELSGVEQTLVIHAINERFLELGLPERLPRRPDAAG